MTTDATTARLESPRHYSTPNVRQFMRWCRVNAPIAEAVLLAQAAAELTRERVDAYAEPILREFAFRRDLVPMADADRATVITRTGDLYLSGASEARFDEFYGRLHAAHHANGFGAVVGGEVGRCPALMAEDVLRQAQNALIAQSTPLFGVEPGALFGENRRKFLDLLIGACMKEVR